MTHLAIFLWGVVFTLFVETVILMFATEVLEKKVQESADKTTEMV